MSIIFIVAGVIHIAAVAPTEINSNTNNKFNQTGAVSSSSGAVAATEVNFEHLETRYYTGSPPTGQSHEYLNDEDHYDSSYHHHQQDGTHFSGGGGASASSLISRGECSF